MRQQCTEGIHEFLVAPRRGNRVRAVVVVGPPGVGKSWMLQELHAQLLAESAVDPTTVRSLDDVDLEGGTQLVAQACSDLEAAGGGLLVASARKLPVAVRDLLDRRCDRRIVPLHELAYGDAIGVLEALGVPAHGLRCAELLHRTRTADGGWLPRDLVDASYETAAVDWTGDTWLQHAAAYPTLHDWSLAVERCDQAGRAAAQDLAATPGDEPDLLLVQAECALLDGNLEAVIEPAERAVVHAQHGGADWLALRAAVTASFARALLDDPTGLESLYALVATSERSGYPDVTALALRRIHNTFWSRGDIAMAHQTLLRLTEVADAGRVVRESVIARVLLGEHEIAVGNLDRAAALLDEAVAAARAGGMDLAYVSAAAELARVWMLLGKIPQARAIAEEALARLPDGAHGLERIVVCVIVARVRSNSGDADGALSVLGTPADCRAALSSPSQAWYLAVEAGRVLAAHGGTAEQIDAWLDAIIGVDGGIGGDIEAARLELRAWRALQAGDAKGAAVLAVEARAAWTAAGCDEELPATSALVGTEAAVPQSAPAASVVAPDDATDPFGGVLTPREHEIALLVADGFTNPEIAARLHLSPRTVEHHVASLLRKLELPNRRALMHQSRASAS